MTSDLFEAIENKDLIAEDGVNLENIKRMSPSDILEFAEQTQELTSSRHMKRETSPYVFSSSLSLGGGTYPCSSLNCRLEKVKNLAQFSALYSDRVYINYYPSDYLNHLENIKSVDKAKLQRRFANDISILLYLRPLIESKKIIPVTHPTYCPHCLAIKSFGEDADKKFENIFSTLTKRYSEETTVTVEKIGKTYFLHVNASETLLEHGVTAYRSQSPFRNLKKMPEILEQVESGKKVNLSTSEIRKLEIDKQLASIVGNNLGFELASTQSINTNFLTDRNLDIEVLKDLSGDKLTNERNQLIQEYLTYLVPFVEDADPTELLSIRKNEEDSFLIFRNGLNQIVDEYRKQKGEFTANSAREIYGDIIEPKLAQLNNKVKIAQKTFIKNTASKVIGWTGAISIGWYAGLLPTDLVTAATALGLIKIAAELTENALNKSDSKDSVRDEPMYYLWKVKKTLDKKNK